MPQADGEDAGTADTEEGREETWPPPPQQGSRKWYETFAIFATLGMGANWVLPTALFQQIPYLERRLKDHLCLSSRMNASVNCGVVAVVFYFYLLRRYGVENLPHRIVVTAVLVASMSGTLLAAGVYDLEVFGQSFPLYLVCAIGGAVGSTSAVVMNPYLMKFRGEFITASRSGGSGLILLTGVVAFIQRPGSVLERFSPAVFFTVFGVILIAPLFALAFIERHKPGLRDGSGEAVVEEDWQSSSHPLHVQGKEAMRRHEPEQEVVVGELMLASTFTGGGWDCGEAAAGKVSAWIVKGCLSLLTAVFPSWTQQSAWLPSVLPYCLCVGLVNFNAWGFLSSVTPFAFASSSAGLGSENLATAYELGSFALVLGDLSTTRFHLPFHIALGFFLFLAAVIYAAALGAPSLHTPAAGPVLIAAFSLSRFLEAHIVTAAYRCVAATLGPAEREHGARAIGIVDLASTTLGSISSTLLINSVVRC